MCEGTSVSSTSCEVSPSFHFLALPAMWQLRILSVTSSPLSGRYCTEANKQKIFRFNPGKTLKLFPPQHPYLPKGCDGCTAKQSFARGDRDICTTCTQIRSYALNQIKNRAVKEMKAQHLPPIKIRSTNYVTGEMYCGNFDRKNLIQHVEDISILPVALDIDNILPTLQDGQREDMIPSHTTTSKVSRHVVKYSKYTIIRQVRVNGQTVTKTLQLKCEIREYGRNRVEYPYSIRELRQ